MRTLSLAAGTLLAALAFSTTGAQAASGIPKPIAAAVADPARPDADRKADADRKPDESVAFAGLKPGQKVADLLPGGGYFTRIFSAVVGPTGHVFAVAPAPRPGAPDRTAAAKAIAADPHYSNVSVSQVAFATLTTLALPEPVDLVWTSRNYHDFHNIPNADVGAIDKAIFDALKPGGVYIVLDHAAEKGSGFRDTSTLHRVDPEAVKQEVVAAGFKFEGQSESLRNSDDPHTAKVFDASVQGKTDQFILKFRKPK
jgi:predicted methyltransferase